MGRDPYGPPPQAGERQGWRFAPPQGQPAAAKGRIARGSELLDAAWAFLRAHPRLTVIPGMSAAVTTVAALLLFAPVFVWADQEGLTPKLALLVATIATILPFTFVSTFFNVAFLSMVLDVRAGRPPSVRRSLSHATARLGPIVAWSLLASLVGSVLSALRHVPGVEWVGQVVAGLGGLAWGLATYFVVPILALHGTGARESVRRSAGVFRRRWGEQVTGEIVIGVVFGVLMIPGAVAACAGVVALESSLVTGAVLIAVAVVLLAPLFVASSALQQLFQLDLYRYAVSGEADGLFTQQELESTFKPKRRWWKSG
jgi:hypothetical protein